VTSPDLRTNDARRPWQFDFRLSDRHKHCRSSTLHLVRAEERTFDVTRGREANRLGKGSVSCRERKPRLLPVVADVERVPLPVFPRGSASSVYRSDQPSWLTPPESLDLRRGRPFHDTDIDTTGAFRIGSRSFCRSATTTTRGSSCRHGVLCARNHLFKFGGEWNRRRPRGLCGLRQRAHRVQQRHGFINYVTLDGAYRSAPTAFRARPEAAQAVRSWAREPLPAARPVSLDPRWSRRARKRSPRTSLRFTAGHLEAHPPS